MKTICFCVLIFHCTFLLAQEPRIDGYVTELNSGKKMVKGVLVKAAAPARTNQVTTFSDGSFTLIFQDMAPGQNVFIEAKKAGWEIVNEKEMRAVIPESNSGLSFKIIMCPTQKLELVRKEYYKITDQYINREYEKKMAVLDRSKADWQQKAKELNEQLVILRKQVTAIAKEYSRTNIDDLIGIEKQAVEMFKAGKIEESIKLRESMESGKKLKEANDKLRELDSVKKPHTHNLKRLAEYRLVFNFIKAESAFEHYRAIKANACIRLFERLL